MKFASFAIIFSVSIFLIATMGYFFRIAAMSGTANWRIAARLLPHGNAGGVANGTAIVSNAFCVDKSANADVKPAVSSTLTSSSASQGMNPLVNFLDKVGASTSFAARAKLALGMGMRSYAGTQEQDAQLLQSLNAIPDFWGGAAQAGPTAVISDGGSCIFTKDLLSSLN